MTRVEEAVAKQHTTHLICLEAHAQPENKYQHGWSLRITLLTRAQDSKPECRGSLWNSHVTEHNSILQTSAYAGAVLCYGVVCKHTGRAALGLLTSWQATLNIYKN